jgi:hypothetical protein
MIFSKALFNGIYKINAICLEKYSPIHTPFSLKSCCNKRVLQGMPYFLSFTTAFPTVLISQASEEQVLKLWQGLDIILEHVIYKTAQYVATELSGVFRNLY